MKKITVIGGGTGTFVVLSGLKQYPLDLGVIVTMMDSGGSTGRLRDQLGVLPPGDLRQCLVALSEAPVLWRKLFLYRFESGDFEGHNFGNLFLSALEKVSSDYDEVLQTVSFVLKTKGQVLPVTYDKAHLAVKYQNGKTIIGENNIEENIEENSPIVKAFLDIEAAPNPNAIARLKESDTIIVGPGDLYTSIVPVLLVKGVKEAIQSAKAKIIYVMNLMTKIGQTNNFTAYDHLEKLTEYLGRKPDIIIFNSAPVPESITEWYKKNNEKPVKNNLKTKGYQGQILESDIIDVQQFEQTKSDKLSRSILRHDSEKLAQLIKDLI